MIATMPGRARTLSKIVGRLPLRSKLIGCLEVFFPRFREDKVEDGSSSLVERGLRLRNLALVFAEFGRFQSSPSLGDIPTRLDVEFPFRCCFERGTGIVRLSACTRPKTHSGKVNSNVLSLIVVLEDLGGMTGDEIACGLGEGLVVCDECINTKRVKTSHHDGAESCHEEDALQVTPEG
jgi:hypothetical protein